MISVIFQGDSLYLEITMDVLTLDGATTDFSYIDEAGVVKSHICTIDGLNIIIHFTPTESSTMLGTYIYQLKVKDTLGDIDTVKYGQIYVKKSLNPTFGI